MLSHAQVHSNLCSRRLLPMNSQPGFLTPRSRPLVKCDSVSHLCRPSQTPHLTYVPCNLEAPEDFCAAHPYQGLDWATPPCPFGSAKSCSPQGYGQVAGLPADETLQHWASTHRTPPK